MILYSSLLYYMWLCGRAKYSKLVTFFTSSCCSSISFQCRLRASRRTAGPLGGAAVSSVALAGGTSAGVLAFSAVVALALVFLLLLGGVTAVSRLRLTPRLDALVSRLGLVVDATLDRVSVCVLCSSSSALAVASGTSVIVSVSGVFFLALRLLVVLGACCCSSAAGSSSLVLDLVFRRLLGGVSKMAAVVPSAPSRPGVAPRLLFLVTLLGLAAAVVAADLLLLVVVSSMGGAAAAATSLGCSLAGSSTMVGCSLGCSGCSSSKSTELLVLRPPFLGVGVVVVVAFCGVASVRLVLLLGVTGGWVTSAACPLLLVARR